MTNRPSFQRANAWVGPASFDAVFTIIGQGATGSRITAQLARMGVTRFVLYDADVVEPHNLPNQAFDTRHVGMNKVDAMAQLLKEFNPDIQVEAHNEFFDSNTEINDFGPVVLATDTMSSRREIMEVCNQNVMVDNVFETRLGFHHGELSIIDTANASAVNSWLATLRSDEEIPEGPCNQRTCTTLVDLISAFTVHQLCEKYHAQAEDTQWKYDKRTLIQMNPKLSVITL